MYASRTTQFIVGLFGLLGIGALAILALELGKIPLVAAPSYTLYATFDNASGLKDKDAVTIAGVKVGKVVAIALKGERARVTMKIDDGVKIDDEAIAAIKTSGIIGDKYVSVSPGAGERNLANGGVIMQTESAFVLEDAIGQLINSSGSAGGANAEKNNGAANQVDSGPKKNSNNHNKQDKMRK